MVETDWALVGMTGALTLATAFLAYHAMKLWKTTKEIAYKERALKLMPKLMLDTVPEMGQATACRFSVKNVGFGYAINLDANEILADRTRSRLMPVGDKEFVETNSVYNWDIPNSSVGQRKNIEIKYTDILSEHSHTFAQEITVR